MATIKTNDSATLANELANALQYAFSYGTTGMIANQVYKLEAKELEWGSPSTNITASNVLSKSVLYKQTPVRDENGRTVGYADGNRKIELTGKSSEYSKLAWSENYSTKNTVAGTVTQSTNKESTTSNLDFHKLGVTKPLSIDRANSTYAYSQNSTGTAESSSKLVTGTLAFQGHAEYQKSSGQASLQRITINTYSDTQSEKSSTRNGTQTTTENSSYNFSLTSKAGLNFDASNGAFSADSALDSLKYVSTKTSNAVGIENFNGSYQASAQSSSLLSALAGYLNGTTNTLPIQQALLAGDDVIVGTDKTYNWLYGGDGDDSITGNIGNDEIYGGSGNDKLYGMAGDDVLFGGDGNDLLDGGAGIDTMVGGAGDDIYILDDHRELERINRDSDGIYTDPGNDTLRITYKNTAKTALVIDLSAANLTEVENVTLQGTGLFEIRGNALNNILDAGKGANTLIGGRGDDTYIVNHKDALIIEDANEGIDTVIASVSWILGNNLENLTLTGKSAINGTGNGLNNILIGNDAANILDGGAGADRMIGGKGNDTYIVDNVSDLVIENFNEGIDTVKASINYALGNNVENLILTGTANLNGTGNALANSITGNDGDNILDGGPGVDKLAGGKGNDTYIVDLIAKGSGTKATVALEDIITEKKGEGDQDTLVLRASNEVKAKLADASKATTLTLAANLENLDASQTGELKLNLTGNATNNTLKGNDAGSMLNGGAGDDIIIGGAGNDIIIGGLGKDILTGGGGADIFRFNSLKELGLGSSQDEITDFKSSEGDKLELKFLKGWILNDSTPATSAKQLWTESYDTNGEQGVILYGNSGGTLAADFSIKLAGVAQLTAQDLILS